MPWSAFWERNFFADELVWLGTLARNYHVRGAVSGIGLVSLGAAGVELVSLLGLWRARRDRLRVPLPEP